MDTASVDNVTSIIIPAFWVSAGIVFYSAVQAAVVGIAGYRRSLYLTFALTCLCAMAYQLATAAYYAAGSVPAAGYALRWQMASAIVFHPAFFGFVALYTGQRRIKLWLIGIVMVFASFLILGLPFPYSLRFTTLEADGLLRLPWGEQLARFKGTPGIWNGLVRAGSLAIFIWAIARMAIQYRRGERRAAVFLLACLVILLAAFMQAGLIDLGIVDSVYMAGFAFLGFVLLMSASMGLELRDQTIALAATTAELRSSVGMLERSEERLRRAMDAGRVGTWEWDMLTNEVGWSDGVERIFGLAAGSFQGTYEAYRALICSEDLQVLDDSLKEAFERDIPYAFEHRITWPNGDVRWLLGQGRVFRDSGGRPVRMRGTVLDITDRKRAEEALRKREQQLRKQSDVLVRLAKSKALENGDLKAAFGEITEAAANTLGIERVNVWLYHEDRSKIRCIEMYERGPDRHSEGQELLAKDYPAYFKGLEEGRTIAAEDARIDPRTMEFSKSYLPMYGISSMLDAPIRLGGQVVGVVCHEHVGSSRLWTVEEQNFAGSMADFVSLAIESSERKKAEETIRERLSFERLISDLSAGFVKVPGHELEAKIVEGLGLIAKFLGVDRVSIGETSQDKQETTIQYSYVGPGIRPLPPTVTGTLFPWYTRMLNGGKCVVISRIPEDLPAEAEAERQFAQKEGIKSTLLVPLEVGGAVIGGMGFTAFQSERSWPDDLVQRLRLVGEMFANALARKRVEEALRESEERFRRLSEGPFEGIGITDQGRVLDANEQLAKILGYKQEELIGMSVSKFVAPESRELVMDKIQSADETPYEHMALRKDGSKFPVEVYGRRIPFKGRMVRVTAVRDITERKRIEDALRNAVEEVESLKDRLQAENVYLQDEIKLQHNFDQFITKSEKVKQVLHKIEQVASTDATVLILGESGTGKELLARAVHQLSNRSDRALVKVNCAALPENLIESELFGHEKGAFTGAVARKAGRFELADGGTIFLDEVGDLPPELQAKLLRILQEGEFERVGSSQTLKVDVRVIAATNRNLQTALKNGSFREDLYYRLNVFPVHIPPLRERREDVPDLARHFTRKFSAVIGKRIEKIPDQAMKSLEEYDWPGNVRELENVIERAVILSNGDTLELEEPLDPRHAGSDPERRSVSLRENEEGLIRRALAETRWTIEGKDGAAARLGIAPSTLRDRIKKYQMEKPQENS